MSAQFDGSANAGLVEGPSLAAADRLDEQALQEAGLAGPRRRRTDALAGLRRSGDVDDRHIAAAERWYCDWVMGVEGAHDPVHSKSGKAGDRHVGMLSRIKASTRCAEVRLALGASAELRLRMMMIEGMSFCEIGRRFMPGDANGRKKVAAQTTLLLEMLADHYHSNDRRAR